MAAGHDNCTIPFEAAFAARSPASAASTWRSKLLAQLSSRNADCAADHGNRPAQSHRRPARVTRVETH